MKTALVMEGGGMRGAYTAGCLSWLIDNGIEFDTHYGISTGAVHLCSFLIKEKKYLYDLSTDYIADDHLVGLKPLLREGRIVGYDYLFNYILPDVFGFDMQKVIDTAKDKSAKIGLYDLSVDKTIYKEIKDLDVGMNLLKGSVTLPIIGRIVKYDGGEYLDGGITDMIPVNEAIKDGNEKYLIITTKPGDYKRKKAGFFLRLLMRLNYLSHPKIAEDYSIRHENYNSQIETIKNLEKENKATWILPSKTIPVSRMKGDKADLRTLYDLGRSDMEARKEEIFAIFKK